MAFLGQICQRPTRIRTYADWYADPNVGCAPPMAELFQFFRFDVQNPAWLRQAVSAALESKLTFVGVGTNGRCYLIHRYQLFIPPVGAQSQFANLGFSTSGDVVIGDSTLTVQPADTFLDQANNGTAIEVPTVGHVVQTLAADNNFNLEFSTGDLANLAAGDKEQVRVRMTAPLPAKYVHHLLGEQVFTARQLWDQLYPPILQAGDAAKCVSLIAWMRAALTMTATVAGGNDRIEVRSAAPTLVDPDDLLMARRRAILDADFPHRAECPNRGGNIVAGSHPSLSSFHST
jgi:hypothetical protein